MKIKNKRLFIILGIIILICGSVFFISQYRAKKAYEENMITSGQDDYLKRILYCSDVKYIEKYKDYYIYRMTLNGKVYFVAMDRKKNSISKNTAYNYDKEVDGRIFFVDKANTVIRVHSYASEQNKDGSYMVTLFNSKEDLKNTIKNSN